MKITIKKNIEKVSVGDIVVEKTTLGSSLSFGVVIEALNQESGYFNVLLLDTDLYGGCEFYVNHHKDLTGDQLLTHYYMVAETDDVHINVGY